MRSVSAIPPHTDCRYITFFIRPLRDYSYNKKVLGIKKKSCRLTALFKDQNLSQNSLVSTWSPPMAEAADV
jgi:hypothetical protein